MSNFFDVRQEPPTADELNKESARRARLAGFTAVAGVAGLWASFQLGCVFFVETGGLSFAGFLVLTGLSLNFVNDLGDKFKVFEAVPQDLCCFLSDYCSKTEEGRVYRKAILQQGRVFTMGEYWALRRWANEQEARTACQGLYGIQTQ